MIVFEQLGNTRTREGKNTHTQVHTYTDEGKVESYPQSTSVLAVWMEVPRTRE